MSKTILFVLLGGLLVLGMSTAFAEDSQLTDQEILKAWGQAQAEVQDTTEANVTGKQTLTDADLDDIDAAGLFSFSGARTYGIINNNGVLNHTRTFTKRGYKVTVCKGVLASC